MPYRLTWRNTRNIEGLATPPSLPLVEATDTASARETGDESCWEEMSNERKISGKKDNLEKLTEIFPFLSILNRKFSAPFDLKLEFSKILVEWNAPENPKGPD